MEPLKAPENDKHTTTTTTSTSRTCTTSNSDQDNPTSTSTSTTPIRRSSNTKVPDYNIARTTSTSQTRTKSLH
eukprot:2130219-Amphidinium_carterae.2